MPDKSKLRKILILGAGTVGQYIADVINRADIDVVVVDIDPVALEEVTETLDVQVIEGNAANPEVLERAGVHEADLVLAFTSSCEVNLLAASIAREMGAKRTVVRARAAWSQDTSRVNLRKRLGIDIVLNPELLTAAEIVRFLDNPDALAMVHYAHGKVQLRQFILDARSPFCGKPLRECKLPPGVLVVVRTRGDEVVIPRGNDDLVAGDRLMIIGLPERLGEAQRLFHVSQEPVRSIVIAGGGNSGFFLAEALEDRRFNVKLIDPDAARCEYLSERLHRTMIIRGDVTRKEFMKEERIGSADVFIAVTRDDEDNLMACLLAKELGVRQTVARVQRPDYASLVQKMGVDMALSPRHIMADRVMGMVLGGRIKAVSLMEEGRVQVIEFLVEAGAPVVGKPLSAMRFPRNALVSAIVRHRHVIVPSGNDRIEAGDTVIVATLTEEMDEIERLFEVRG